MVASSKKEPDTSTFWSSHLHPNIKILMKNKFSIDKICDNKLKLILQKELKLKNIHHTGNKSNNQIV